MMIIVVYLAFEYFWNVDSYICSIALGHELFFNLGAIDLMITSFAFGHELLLKF